MLYRQKYGQKSYNRKDWSRLGDERKKPNHLNVLPEYQPRLIPQALSLVSTLIYVKAYSWSKKRASYKVFPRI
jgi:hypothetical protein